MLIGNRTKYYSLDCGLVWLQVNSCRRQSLVRSQPPVAPPGESEDTTDSGRGSSVDVSGRRVGLSSTRKGPAVQTTTLPPCQHLPQNGKLQPTQAN